MWKAKINNDLEAFSSKEWAKIAAQAFKHSQAVFIGG